MARHPNHFYLRLIEIGDPTPGDRISAVMRALENLPELKLLHPPRLDAKGGIELFLDLPHRYDRLQLGVKWEELGYHVVF